MATHVARDADICTRYTNGEPIDSIVTHFGITRGRLYQILHKHGIYKKDRPVIKKSDRDEFLGVNLNEADKQALRAEAERRGISMSALTSDLIKDMLASLHEGAQP